MKCTTAVAKQEKTFTAAGSVIAATTNQKQAETSDKHTFTIDDGTTTEYSTPSSL